MLGDLPAALAACSEGLESTPTTPSCSSARPSLHRSAGQPAEAEAGWRRVLTLKRPEQFCSVDQGIYGHLTLRNLALLAVERGDHGESANLWRRVLDECPQDREARERLQSP